MNKDKDEIMKESDKDSKSSRSNKGGRGNNGRNKPNNRGNRPKDKDRPNKTKGSINDTSFYYEDKTVLDQIMNFSFNEFGGIPVNVKYDPENLIDYQYYNPMIEVIHLNPAIPTSAGELLKGINTAALRNFLMLSGSNAKTTMYQPNDVILLILALGEILKMIGFFVRLFCVVPLFNYRNRAYPRMLLQAMGIDVEDFYNNLADYRLKFNQLLYLLSKIPFPAGIPYFTKCASMYSYIYVDDDKSPLAQTYFFVPESTWIYDEVYNENGGGLKQTNLIIHGGPDYGNYELRWLLEIFEQQITALLDSTVFNYIYSDVLRLVQLGKVTQLLQYGALQEGAITVPLYNDEIKNWIHNLAIIGTPTGGADDPIYTEGNDICCDAITGGLKYNPLFSGLNPGYDNMLIDFEHDNVSVDERVEATRLATRMHVIFDEESNKYVSDPSGIAVLDNYVVALDIFSGEETDPMTIEHSFIKMANNASVATYRKFIKTLAAVNKFKWCPMLYWVTEDDTHHWDMGCVSGDLDYYTTLDFDDLRSMYDYEVIHLMSVLS